MNGINEVLLLGTVGADPETKVINENSRVSTFRMATSETFTDKSGVKKEVTEWHTVEAWNFLSDTISNYVKKGTHLIIKGKIKTDTYDDKENPAKKIYRTKIVMDNLHFLPGGKKAEEQTNQPAQQPIQYAQPVQQPIQYAQPVQQPIQYAQPVQQPIQQPIQYAQPVQQPIQYAQPVQQPVQQPIQYSQPVQQPVQYVQPVQQPVQQSRQPVQNTPLQSEKQVDTYMTDQQFIANMNSPDDLPF